MQWKETICVHSPITRLVWVGNFETKTPPSIWPVSKSYLWVFFLQGLRAIHQGSRQRRRRRLRWLCWEVRQGGSSLVPMDKTAHGNEGRMSMPKRDFKMYGRFGWPKNFEPHYVYPIGQRGLIGSHPHQNLTSECIQGIPLRVACTGIYIIWYLPPCLRCTTICSSIFLDMQITKTYIWSKH